MARAKRKQVIWKVDRESSPVMRPRPYIPDVPLTEETSKSFEGQLESGNLFFTTKSLSSQDQSRGTIPPPYPYLFEVWGWGQTIEVPAGSMAVYSGTIRVEETKGQASIRSLRHSFIIGGKRYITNNLNHFSPALWKPSE